jgi:molybdopterin biosynthesis enzyme
MFFEGLGSASVVNGVLRIETFHRNAKGEDVSSGELIIPTGRVIPVAEALKALIERIREQDAAQRAELENAAAEVTAE